MEPKGEALDLAIRAAIVRMTRYCRHGVPYRVRHVVYPIRANQKKAVKPLGPFQQIALECIKDGAPFEDAVAPLDAAADALFVACADQGLLPDRYEAKRVETRATHQEDLAEHDAQDFPSLSTLDQQIDALHMQMTATRVKLFVTLQARARLTH